MCCPADMDTEEGGHTSPCTEHPIQRSAAEMPCRKRGWRYRVCLIMSHRPEGHTRSVALAPRTPGCRGPCLLCPRRPQRAPRLLPSATWFFHIDSKIMAFHEINFDWENKLFSHLGARSPALSALIPRYEHIIGGARAAPEFPFKWEVFKTLCISLFMQKICLFLLSTRGTFVGLFNLERTMF